MITIIGAGPAGSYTAYLLAKQGQEVTIIEEHNSVGNPVQCTGIVTESIKKFLDIPNNVIAKKLDTVNVISKNNNIKVKTDELVMWRNKFDQFVNEKAISKGAKVLTNHQFISIEGKNKIKIKDKTNNKIKIIESSHIIGADGPSSQVAKAADLNSKSKFYIGMQAKIKLKTDFNTFETHFGENFPNFFGWVVPESEDTVRPRTWNISKYKRVFLQISKKQNRK